MGLFGKRDDTTAEEYYDRAMEEYNKDDPDYKVVFDNLYKAKKKGSADACFRLGRCYHYGIGVEKDDKEAVYYLEIGVDRGSTEAANLLGTMYDLGQGVRQDSAKCVRLYRWGAERGNVVSFNNLGYMYEHGRGVPQDYYKAFCYYDKAYSGGNAMAAKHLGDCYQYGRGTPTDIKLAGLCYEVAFYRGCEKAREPLDQLHKEYYVYDSAKDKWLLKSELPPEPEVIEDVEIDEWLDDLFGVPEPETDDKPAAPPVPKNQRTHINVGTIGLSGAGKTTLTAAITAVLSERYGLSKAVGVDEIDNRQEEKEKRRSVCVSAVEYRTPDRHFAHFDLPGHREDRDHFFAGASLVDIALLVVKVAGDGEIDRRQLFEQILLARAAGIPKICFFINGFDLLDADEVEEEDWDLTEMTVRDLLTDGGYDGDNTLCMKGSAQQALDDPWGEWGDRIVELIEGIERVFSYTEMTGRDDLPFYMPVQDVRYVPLRGMAVIGRVERGTLRPMESVDLTGWFDERYSASATGIQVFGQPAETAKPGDYVGVLLRGVGRDSIHKGQVLTAPGAARARKRFIAQTYILTKEEGGRHRPFFEGYSPHFYLRTAQVTGRVELPELCEMVMPGDNVELTVELERPVAIEEGLRFAVRDNGRTIGTGRIVAILD